MGWFFRKPPPHILIASAAMNPEYAIAWLICVHMGKRSLAASWPC